MVFFPFELNTLALGQQRTSLFLLPIQIHTTSLQLRCNTHFVGEGGGRGRGRRGRGRRGRGRRGRGRRGGGGEGGIAFMLGLGLGCVVVWDEDDVISLQMWRR